MEPIVEEDIPIVEVDRRVVVDVRIIMVVRKLVDEVGTVAMWGIATRKAAVQKFK
jgi:hypothetical protein